MANPIPCITANNVCVCILDYQGELQELAFVQYTFDNLEHSIEIKPHGNSKGKMPFSRCKPSTIKKLKTSAAHKPPTKALREVENTMGGIMEARSPCDLPRNRKQVYNINCAAKRCVESSLLSTSPTISRIDVLAQVMQKCKETVGSQAYIRSVEAAPEPMCVLATDQQLLDLERFCTGDEFGIIGIDPTFNLGPFYVTPITYQNLHVKTQRGNHPIILGPVLIHHTKTFRSFYYFASTLVRLNPKLVNLKAFGTDGEGELIKSFSIAFPKAVHLRCMNHLRQNVKDKLRDLRFPNNISKEFLVDIFGCKTGSHLEIGLVDAASDDSFWNALENLQEKWSNLERGYIHPDSDPQFYEWFCRYKADEIVKCVLPNVRVKAGLKDPSLHFTTNCSESLNHVIKKEVDWKENKLPILIEHLRSVTDRYKEELEKAVVGRGEWRFTPEYCQLEVSEVTWFSKMNVASKEKHMKEVLNFPVASMSKEPSQLSTSSQTNSVSAPALTISVQECGITSLAMTLLNDIWEKAERLLSMEGGILKVPWSTDKSARLVMSSSSEHPHFVKTNPRSKKQYICDEKCLMFKGSSICSHTVAASHDNGDLSSFIEFYKQKKCGPNLAAVAGHGLPSGSGRKGGNPRKKKQTSIPVETRSVRPCFLNSEAETSPALENEPQPPTSTSLPRKKPCVSIPARAPSAPQCVGVSSANMTRHSTAASACDPTVPSSIASGFGIVVGGSVNISNPNHSFINSPATLGRPTSQFSNMLSSGLVSEQTNPFVLKFKTNQMKVCQSCRKNYEDANDTMGLVVARAERRMVSNLATGTQFLGRESNSHYHALMACLRQAKSSFTGTDLVIPVDVKENLTSFQKIFLVTCLQVPNLLS